MTFTNQSNNDFNKHFLSSIKSLVEPMQVVETSRSRSSQVRNKSRQRSQGFEGTENAKTFLCKFFSSIPIQIMMYAKSLGLVEPSNVIMCDPVLEDVLQTKALHLKQLGKYVESFQQRESTRRRQRSDVSSMKKGSALKTSDDKLRGVKSTVNFKKEPYMKNFRLADISMRLARDNCGPEQLPTVNEEQAAGRPRTMEASTQTEFPVEPRPSQPTTTVSQGNNTLATQTGKLYLMSESFGRAMRSENPECVVGQPVEFSEAVKFFSKYVIKRKARLFDKRNILVAIIKDDPLAEIFKVKAFHRDQAKTYIKEQLTEIII